MKRKLYKRKSTGFFCLVPSRKDLIVFHTYKDVSKEVTKISLLLSLFKIFVIKVDKRVQETLSLFLLPS